ELAEAGAELALVAGRAAHPASMPFSRQIHRLGGRCVETPANQNKQSCQKRSKHSNVAHAVHPDRGNLEERATKNPNRCRSSLIGDDLRQDWAYSTKSPASSTRSRPRDLARRVREWEGMNTACVICRRMGLGGQLPCRHSLERRGGGRYDAV